MQQLGKRGAAAGAGGWARVAGGLAGGVDRSGRATTAGGGAASLAGGDPGLAEGRRSGVGATGVWCWGAIGSAGLVGGWSVVCRLWELIAWAAVAGSSAGRSGAVG